METDPAPAWALEHYRNAEEEGRLRSRSGLLEQERLRELLHRYLPRPPARVADIGAGPGAYSLWLAERGYQVAARDLVPLHVEQLREAARARQLKVDAAVADARRLDLADASADVALLFGPLYHLYERTGRLQALSEAARIVVPGGLVMLVAISRWAALLDGVLLHRIGEGVPGFAAVIDRAVQSGRLDPLNPGGFSCYAHRPAELQDEVAQAGLHQLALVSVEGSGAYLADLEARWESPLARAAILDVAHRLESVPELLGVGPHLLLIAQRT